MSPPVIPPKPDDHQAVLEGFLAHLRRVCRLQSEWPLKVKVSIGAALDFAAAAPERAKLLTRGPSPVLPGDSQVAFEARDHLAAMLASGRSQFSPDSSLPGLTEQMLVGGLQAVIAVRLMDGEALQLPDLAPQLVQIVLIPYLGAKEAARVAGRPKPTPPEL
ncbi:MAG: hypothetical protein H0X42_05690 [Solirubrobacterales bacterium]|nr:hypothetical protein [Solirubrobacterales bacterium]